jgi:hypothetical protein
VIDSYGADYGTSLATYVSAGNPATMYQMAYGRRAQRRRRTFGVAILILSVGLGCGRQPAASSATAAQQALPFHSAGNPDADAPRPVLPEDVKSTTAVPFHSSSRSRILPTGTLLTVRLQGSLFAAKAHAGDSFTAVVADPLTADGELLVQRGAFVTGRVESARLEMNRNPPLGYLRLTLHGINLRGRTLTLRTSSLFARATARASTASAKSVSVQVPDGRRLTFRLIAPVALDEQPQTAYLQKLSSVDR